MESKDEKKEALLNFRRDGLLLFETPQFQS